MSCWMTNRRLQGCLGYLQACSDVVFTNHLVQVLARLVRGLNLHCCLLRAASISAGTDFLKARPF